MDREPWLEASQEAGRVIEVDEWAEIRRLHRAEGMGIKAIARRLGLARNTVRAALRAPSAPRYERVAKGSIVDAVEPQVIELLREFPAMPATVIAERIDWQHSIRVLRDRVGELITASVGGRELTEAGLSGDVELACDVDSSKVVPVLTDGIFTAREAA